MRRYSIRRHSGIYAAYDGFYAVYDTEACGLGVLFIAVQDAGGSSCAEVGSRRNAHTRCLRVRLSGGSRNPGGQRTRRLPCLTRLRRVCGKTGTGTTRKHMPENTQSERGLFVSIAAGPLIRGTGFRLSPERRWRGASKILRRASGPPTKDQQIRTRQATQNYAARPTACLALQLAIRITARCYRHVQQARFDCGYYRACGSVLPAGIGAVP